MKLLFSFVLAILLYGCNVKADPVAEVQKKQSLRPGTWQMTFDIANSTNPVQNITVRFEVDSSSTITFINHTERMVIDDVRLTNDSIIIVPKQFNSMFKGVMHSSNQFSGHWFNYAKKDYSIPFMAEWTDENTWVKNCDDTNQKKYEVSFSPNTENKYQALGIFNTCSGDSNNYCYGTFLTETGDYRFLEGQIIDNQLKLVCFDGSHLFKFTGTFAGDSIINGTFNSGKHWYENWHGKNNSMASLKDPNSLTYLKEGYETIDIKVQNLNGDTIHFTSEFYQNKVSVITIMGTWCPNCVDEAKYFNELFLKYHKQGLVILPVAFEASEDFTTNILSLKKFFGFHHLSFQPYYGGTAKKSIAGEKFYMLNKIMSYPTSIFIDKTGKVRKIHTGFYGPGTGVYYENYKRETEDFVKQLLEE